jgi:hypothetical protein
VNELKNAPDLTFSLVDNDNKKEEEEEKKKEEVKAEE